MKTKFVYVVVSSLNDILLEEAWVSIWSLKYYNPDAYVEVVADKETVQTFDDASRKQFKDLVNNIISVDFESNVSNLERSRWLKTRLRQIVSGDYLYLDSDTIITDSLTDIDHFDMDLGMVYDLHSHSSARPEILKRWVKDIFDYRFKKEDFSYFNSGVIYARDIDEIYIFYERWHSNWLHSKKSGVFFDQLSLNKVNDEMGGVITPISGEYNCQIAYTIKYLHKAKIIHFAVAPIFGLSVYPISPFQQKSFYEGIKAKGSIDEDAQSIILNSKSAFDVPTMPIGKEDFMFLSSRLIRHIRKIYNNHSWIFKFVEKL